MTTLGARDWEVGVVFIVIHSVHSHRGQGQFGGRELGELKSVGLVNNIKYLVKLQ